MIMDDYRRLRMSAARLSPIYDDDPTIYDTFVRLGTTEVYIRTRLLSHAFTFRIPRRSHRLKMVLQPVQRLPLIQNLVELERGASDNHAVIVFMLENQRNRRRKKM